MRESELESWARELALARPELDRRERDRLIFACGVAAGRQASHSRTRLWRLAAVAGVVLAITLRVWMTRTSNPPGDLAAESPSGMHEPSRRGDSHRELDRGALTVSSPLRDLWRTDGSAIAASTVQPDDTSAPVEDRPVLFVGGPRGLVESLD
jgi:hypothetical protein